MGNTQILLSFVILIDDFTAIGFHAISLLLHTFVVTNRTTDMRFSLQFFQADVC